MNPKQFLDKLGIVPKKSLGQNFLHDPGVLGKIAASAGITPTDAVLEIGPGLGSLTEVLSKLSRRVVAVELDSRMLPVLDRFSVYGNVEIIHGDILAVDLDTIMGPQPYVVCANVPYYITSAIIRYLLERTRRPRTIVLTVQAEVAERLLAVPGDHSLLSVSTQFYAKPKIVSRISRGAFYPQPEVDSAVIRLDVHPQPIIDVPSSVLFFRVVKAGFSQKRKQLKNTLGDGLHQTHATMATLMETAGVDPRRRAETLSLPEWAAITRQYAALITPPAQPD